MPQASSALTSTTVRIAQDETVKTKIDEDMYAVPDETVYADFDVDPETGEATEVTADA